MRQLHILSFIILYTLLSCSKSNSSNGQQTIDLCIDKSGREYQTINIAGQIWMSENLAYLPQIDKEYSNSMSEERFYVYGYNGLNIKEAQNEFNYKIYGVLYNKEAALRACPDGWHLPSDAEWKVLELALGIPLDKLDQINNRGNESISLKSRSTNLWKANNGTNSNGLNIVPAGYKDSESFKNIGVSSTFWTSSNYNKQKSWIREFSYIKPGIMRVPAVKQTAYSVRCVKNK